MPQSELWSSHITLIQLFHSEKFMWQNSDIDICFTKNVIDFLIVDILPSNFVFKSIITYLKETLHKDPISALKFIPKHTKLMKLSFNSLFFIGHFKMKFVFLTYISTVNNLVFLKFLLFYYISMIIHITCT